MMRWGRVFSWALLVVLVAVLGIAPLLAAPEETLSLAFLAGFKEDVLRANIGAFVQKTGIRVDIDTAPYNDLYKKELLSLSTGARRYDVLFMDEPWVPALASFLLPLGDVVKEVGASDFVPTTLAAGQYDGTQYTLPVDPNVLFFIYRKDLFQERGLRPPDTWADVLRDAQILNDPGKGIAGFDVTAGSDIQTFAYLTTFLWSWGVEILDQNGRAAVDTPAAREAAEYYVNILKYCPPAVRSYTFADVTKTMQLGKAAMAVQWASGARPLEDKANSLVAGKLGYIVLPKGVRRTPMRGVWTIGIAKTTSKRDAARKFVEWITSRDFGMAAALYPATSSAIHSPRVSVLSDPMVQQALPYAPALLQSLRIAKSRPRVPQWPDIQEQIRLAGSRITTGEVSVAAGLRELAASINRIMSK